MKWKYIVFDIETDGFTPSEIYMISMMDLMSGEQESFIGPEEVPIGLSILDQAIMVSGHAIRFFDCQVIEVLTDGLITFNNEKMVDTLHMSQHLRKKMKKHGLETWGGLLDLPKMEKPDFSAGFNDEWIPYCERDVALNYKVFFTLFEELMIRYPDAVFPDQFKGLNNYLRDLT